MGSPRRIRRSEATAARRSANCHSPEGLLPLSQHAGKPAVPLVQAGDRVERGDKVAEADGWMSSPVHASAAGTVRGIELCPHPSGAWQPAIRIAVAPHSAQVPRRRMIPDWHGLTREHWWP
jgi:electron transport complex protein RnfC